MRRSEALKIQAHCPAGADIDHDTDKGASFCHTCSQTVHDLSGMRESEVDAFLKGLRGKSACVSYRVDRRGEPLLLADPPSRLRRRSNALAGMGLAGTLSACAPWGVEAGPVSQLPTQAAELRPRIGSCAVSVAASAERQDRFGEWEVYYGPRVEKLKGSGRTRLDGDGNATVRLDFELDPEVEVERVALGRINAGPVEHVAGEK